MKAVKRINNNAVMCEDARGRSVVAFGKGIAFSIDKQTQELPLAVIERTFYNIDDHYLALLDELDPNVLNIAADIIEAASVELPYELNANAALALADHITFALYRAKNGLNVQMPFSYDVAQMYPIEYRVGQFAIQQINRRLNVELPDSEATGMALCVISSSAGDAEALAQAAAVDDTCIDAVTKIIEGRYDIHIDRQGFEYARFATHMHYLLTRMRTGEAAKDENAELYETVRAQSERSTVCLDEACELLTQAIGCDITADERLYLLMHIMRLAHPRH